VSPVKYVLGFYNPEDDILHSHCRENFKSYVLVNIQNRTELPSGEQIVLASGLLIQPTLDPEDGGNIPATGYEVRAHEMAPCKRASSVCTSPAELALFLQVTCSKLADKA
jgi:hypothetical protein